MNDKMGHAQMTKPDMTEMNAFVKVAARRSFRKAADVLAPSPSTVSPPTGLGIAYVFKSLARDALKAGRLISVFDAWRPSLPGAFLYQARRKTPTFRAGI
ncbi:hypothetical protein [Martelella alba]|uniref:LysR family transcriptional regulator n=1 Tax=Martelella alba TaxID=2590451 RepID=A0ABY2SHX1_9HYPH|nr:hypothetical protein [Martelella alba]TKI04927.1 hypothetical protein FCN80_16555 [Martelella alba]